MRAEPDDTACLLYTGGHTGLPKGAELTQRNLLVNAMQCQVWLKTETANEIVLAALPLLTLPFVRLDHLHETTASIAASTVILIPNPRDLKFVLDNIQKHRPTFFPSVPTMYVAVKNHPGYAPYDLSSIKACISGGSGLPQEVQERFQELTGGRLVEGYGLTEASPVTHANPVNNGCRIGTIGLPWPNTDCRSNHSMARAARWGRGSGRAVHPRAAGDEGLLEQTRGDGPGPQGGWLHTGDVAVMDERDGYFPHRGRMKDMIHRRGVQHLPREVEEVLYQHGSVQEAGGP